MQPTDRLLLAWERKQSARTTYRKRTRRGLCLLSTLRQVMAKSTMEDMVQCSTKQWVGLRFFRSWLRTPPRWRSGVRCCVAAIWVFAVAMRRYHSPGALVLESGMVLRYKNCISLRESFLSSAYIGCRCPRLVPTYAEIISCVWKLQGSPTASSS
jgi:hypothetical protein